MQEFNAGFIDQLKCYAGLGAVDLVFQESPKLFRRRFIQIDPFGKRDTKQLAELVADDRFTSASSLSV